jgi:hypothetical protein
MLDPDPDKMNTGPKHLNEVLVMKLEISGLNSAAILVTSENDKYRTGPTPRKVIKKLTDLARRPDYKKKKSHLY